MTPISFWRGKTWYITFHRINNPLYIYDTIGASFLQSVLCEYYECVFMNKCQNYILFYLTSYHFILPLTHHHRKQQGIPGNISVADKNVQTE